MTTGSAGGWVTGPGVGSVTDSAEAYTARVGSGENEYKLVQALRAYGADAKRFAEAKSGT